MAYRRENHLRCQGNLCLLALLIALAAVAPAHAQVFLASRPHPEFSIGPLFVRATVGPETAPVTVDVLWGLVIPPTRSALDVAQDLHLLWPGAVSATPVPAPEDERLSRYVEARGFTVIESGRLPLFAQELYRLDEARAPLALEGGAPYVTFVRAGGPLGLTPPVTWVRIPWSPRLANRAFLTSLRMELRGAVKPKNATWLERTFWGERHLIALGFNDVRSRALAPMYLEHRDRVIRLGEEPAQVLVNFRQADRLKIDEVFPRTAARQPSETLESTEVVSIFLERAEGLIPQVLTVQFAYFTGWQTWIPVLVAALFFLLGNIAGPVVAVLIRHFGPKLAGRIHVGPVSRAPGERKVGTLLRRETLERLRPGVTTREEVLGLCGPPQEEGEKLTGADETTLVYRGRRLVPQQRRRLPFVTTVQRWDAEEHEVVIALAAGRVRDVETRVRRARAAGPGDE